MSGSQLLDHSHSLFSRRRDVLARVDRLEHGRDLPHPGRGYVSEDVAVPMHNAALPGRLGEQLGRALGKPDAGIRGDQPDLLETTLLEVLEERTPARLVLLRPLANAKNLERFCTSSVPSAGRFMIRSRTRVVKRHPEGDW